MTDSDTIGAVPRGSASFDTTHWSVIAAAGDQHSPKAAEALESLCRIYWYPLYAYARRRGLPVADAQDVTQEFFHRLIRRNFLGSADRSKGSFRSFLLASVNHLLANEWDKARALKRGGGRQILSLDANDAECRFLHEPVGENETAEKTFDRRWALTLLDRALAQLRSEFADLGKLAHFDALKGFLSKSAGAEEYAVVAKELDLDSGAVAVAVHRLRRRYQQAVRAEVAQTVATDAELKTEMRHLLASLE